MQNWVFFVKFISFTSEKRNCFLFLKIKFPNCAHWKKRVILTNFSHFLVTRERLQNFLLHISHSHTCILLTLLTFLSYQFWKKYGFIRYVSSLVWFLVLILIRAILEQSLIAKWWAKKTNKQTNKLKLKLDCLLLICIYIVARFIVIFKPRTLNGGRWRLSSIHAENAKKHCFLAAAILFLSVKLL